MVKISSVFQIPQGLDYDVDPRTIQNVKQQYVGMSTLELIKHLMARLECFNQALVRRDQIKMVEHFTHIMALRELLVPSFDAYRTISRFDQYTRNYLYALIWGIEPEKAPPEIIERIRREVQIQLQVLQIPQIDPRSIAMALGSLLLLI